MGRFLRRLKLIVDQFLYHAFCIGLKIAQMPGVLRERQPRFNSDETFLPANGGVYAIVVKYSGFALGADFIDLLTSLRSADVNIVLVANGKLADSAREALKPYVHRLLVRDNIGRDFGAYRAATIQLNNDGLNPTRLLYCNDSVVYIKGSALDQLAQQLSCSEYDVVGSFENHEYEHHIGSFMFSISGDAFRDQRTQQFWKHYRPYDIRPYVIKNGEIAFSRLLKRRGYRFDVVYSAERLAEQLYALDLIQLVELIRYTRPTFRLQPLNDLMSRSLAARDLSRVLTAPETSMVPAEAGTPKLSAYAARRRSVRNADDADAKVSLVTERLARDALVDRLMIDVTNTSQIHAGFGLFHRMLGSPLIKKDLLARGVYLEHDCALILDRLPADRRAALMRELVTRGRPLMPRGLRHFLLRHGLA